MPVLLEGGGGSTYVFKPPPPKPDPKPADPGPTIEYNPYGYVPGGSSTVVAQTIEAQAIADPGPNPVFVPRAIIDSIPPDTIVSLPDGTTTTFEDATQYGPPSPVPAGTTPLNGLDAVDELFRQAGLHNIDPLAAAANALAEGAGGGIGDDGTAYGPWQAHLTDGRLDAFAHMPRNAEQVQRWAWSTDGFAYVFRSMVAGGAAGKTRHDAVHAIVYGFEKPLDEAGAYTDRVKRYDELASYSGDVRALLAPKFKGVGGTISGTGLPGSPAPTVSPSPVPRPAGVSSAWDEGLALAETGIPKMHDTVRSVGESLVDVFKGG